MVSFYIATNMLHRVDIIQPIQFGQVLCDKATCLDECKDKIECDIHQYRFEIAKNNILKAKKGF